MKIDKPQFEKIFKNFKGKTFKFYDIINDKHYSFENFGEFEEQNLEGDILHEFYGRDFVTIIFGKQHKTTSKIYLIPHNIFSKILWKTPIKIDSIKGNTYTFINYGDNIQDYALGLYRRTYLKVKDILEEYFLCIPKPTSQMYTILFTNSDRLENYYFREVVIEDLEEESKKLWENIKIFI